MTHKIMFTVYLYALASVALVSLISFIGVCALFVKKERLEKITIFLVAVSAGALLGDAFLHLLPEMISDGDGSLFAWSGILGGIIIFFILEKIIQWRHCHLPTCENHPHPVGAMNLVGDALHNFIDGVIIGGTFLVSIPLGLATTLAVIVHEIPQEIGEFGVLIHAGYSRGRALFLNFLSACVAIAGTIFALAVGVQSGSVANFIIPLTAGGFIYIAASDLIPELHKETRPSVSLAQLASILVGIGIMLGLKIFMG